MYVFQIEMSISLKMNTTPHEFEAVLNIMKYFTYKQWKEWIYSTI